MKLRKRFVNIPLSGYIIQLVVYLLGGFKHSRVKFFSNFSLLNIYTSSRLQSFFYFQKKKGKGKSFGRNFLYFNWDKRTVVIKNHFIYIQNKYKVFKYFCWKITTKIFSIEKQSI